MAVARELMQRAVDTWNARDRSAFMALFGPDFELVLPGDIRRSGVEAADFLYSLWQDAYPDNRIEPQRLISEGDAAVLEAIFDGTQTGPLNMPTMALPATNNHTRVPYVVIGSSGSTTLARMVFYYDQVEILTQLGLMPAAATA